jgi:hypothetical protein
MAKFYHWYYDKDDYELSFYFVCKMRKDTNYLGFELRWKSRDPYESWENIAFNYKPLKDWDGVEIKKDKKQQFKLLWGNHREDTHRFINWLFKGKYGGVSFE